jgi:cytochrome bd ubiquinol oxidase subunit II
MLETIWFVLWGMLWAIYFLLDGFDFGIGTLMPFIAKNNTEKRLLYNTMGPFWDGNEVWLVTAGGVTFAAFPGTYAVMFSTLYLPLFLLLIGLILRGVAFEFRNKVDNVSWRSIWDGCLVVGSFVPALLFGVAFANIFKGIPFDANGIYHGTFWTLLNPYGIIGGLFFVSMFLLHGALWILFKIPTNDLANRVKKLVPKLWWIWLGLAVLMLGISWFYTNLWKNYLTYPWLLIIPAAAVIHGVMNYFTIKKGDWLKAWMTSAETIFFCILWGVLGLYPNLYPSSLYNEYSKTIHNSASSPLTLKIMLIVAGIFVPIVIVYQILVYRKFSFKITEEEIKTEEAY